MVRESLLSVPGACAGYLYCAVRAGVLEHSPRIHDPIHFGLSHGCHRLRRFRSGQLSRYRYATHSTVRLRFASILKSQSEPFIDHFSVTQWERFSSTTTTILKTMIRAGRTSKDVSHITYRTPFLAHCFTDSNVVLPILTCSEHRVLWIS